jgi:tight adherence protein C
MPVGIWFAAFAIACALPVAWWAFSGDRVEAKAARANLVGGGSTVTDLRKAVLEQGARDRVVAPTVQALARRARRFTPAGALEGLERRAFLAGLSEAWPAERILATKMMLALVLGFAGVLAFIANPSIVTVFLLAILVGIGWFSVDYLMDLKARDRQRAIERQLPDVLDQITVCVEAGLGFEAAMARVAQNPGPLPQEIGRTLQDIQIGVTRDRALESLLERTDVPDLRTFVHAFVQAERYGIPVAQVLRVQAGEMRDKRKMRAEERAMKMPVKIVFPVVLCILPALFVVVAGPAVVRLSQTTFGG